MVEATVSVAHMEDVTYGSNIVHCLCIVNHETWILDHGASEHMCSNKMASHYLCLLDHPMLINLPNEVVKDC